MLSNDKGFSVIEVLIVMLIISITSTLILPNLHIIERNKLKSQAQMLVDDLQYTQRLALNEKSNIYFKLLKSQKSYIIRKAGSAKNIKSVRLLDNINFSVESRNNIKYTPKGTAGNANDGVSGSGGTITLKSDNYKIKITVSPVTGKVRMYDIL